MLPYQQLDTFRRATVNLESTVEEIKTTIVGGISIAEGARNIALASANICLRAGQTHKVKVKSFRLFPRQDFSLRLPRIPAEQYLEYIPDQIGFIHAPDTRDRGIRSARDAELAISLDILELLYQISRGQVPSPDELSGVYVNLIIFKNALAHLPYQRVLLTRDDEQFFEVALEGVGVARLRKLELEGRPA